MCTVSRRNRQISLQLPRLVVMLLFCVGLATQSVIDISGETHESVLHANTGDAYTHGLHDHHAPGDEPDTDTISSPLHVLLHQPCGGACVFLTAAHPATLLIAPEPAELPAEYLRPVPHSDYQAPFRPPIAG